MVSVVGLRTPFNENHPGEPEQDANTALTELDKGLLLRTCWKAGIGLIYEVSLKYAFDPPTGLRSVRIGEQCEAIVRFPRLFEKYPFPILINSALLKLAEVFRTG